MQERRRRAHALVIRRRASVHTGIAIEFVPTAGGIVKTRSGLAKKRLLCNAGVIDAGYRGEIIVLMENLGDLPYSIHKGDKIAQLLEHPFLAGEVSNPSSAKPPGQQRLWFFGDLAR